MSRRQLLLLTCFALSMFVLVGTVSAQASLVANIARTSEYVWGGDTNDYIADLEFVRALNDSHRRSLFGRLETLRLVKAAFNHFVKEIENE